MHILQNAIRTYYGDKNDLSPYILPKFISKSSIGI